MLKQPIISVSGLRGIVGESLNDEIAARYASAFAAGLPEGLIVLTRDSRPSGPALAQAIAAALTAGGHDVLDAGIAATPTTGVLVRRHAAVGGVQISASHNPSQYNGIKLFDGSGRVLNAAAGERVLEAYQRGQRRESAGRKGVVEACDDAIEDHLRLVLETVDVAAIRQRGFRVLLDSNHGAGAALGRKLLDALGCELRILGEKADGAFAHPPEPLAENLAQVGERVVEFQADVGFCQDPDADRLAIIDENGRYLGEEYTLAICADHVLRQNRGPIVTTCSTSKMTEDVARRHNVPFHRSAVGEANVVDVMLEYDAVFGGEGNGGVIDPRVGLVRDSFVGMALVLDAMAARGVAVSQLANELPRYAICKTKVSLPRDQIAAALDALQAEFPAARANRLDGLRLDWGNPDGSGSWLLVRASNTEPIVRLVAEAPTADGAERLCQEGERVIKRAQSA
jgi:phosphomannomutase